MSIQSFIITLIICSLSMSVFALLYMAISPLLGKRYSEKGRYYAWLIILVGLIIPFRPQWGNSLIGVEIPTDTPQIIVQTVGNAPNIIFPTVNIPPLDNVSTNMPPVSDVVSSGTLVDSTLDVSWWQVAMLIWLVGLFVFIAYQSIKHYRFTKMTRRWSTIITDEWIVKSLDSLKEEMEIIQQIPIYLCKSVGSPMLMGVTNPRILLPTINLAHDEMRFILKHELVHHKRKDILYKILILMATALHWFNPVVYLMARAINLLCETSCDAEVLQSANTDARQSYGETIIGVIQYKSRQTTALSTYFYGGKSNMNNRISSIMDTRKKKFGILVIGVIAFSMIAVGGIFATQAQGETPSINVYEEAHLPRFETLGFTDILDLTYLLEEIGLTFLHNKPFPSDSTVDRNCGGCGNPRPFRWNRESPSIGSLLPDVPIRLASEADIDLLLEISRIIVEQNIVGLSLAECVVDALEASDFYDYWWYNVRIITRPLREKEIIYFAESYTFYEVFEHVFRNEPCLLLEFHELGFFREVSMDDLFHMNLSHIRCICSICIDMNNRFSRYHQQADDTQHSETSDNKTYPTDDETLIPDEPLVEWESPYRIATTIEDVRAVIALQDGTIPITNVDVPEIRSGQVDGIIILEQCLYEALYELHRVYAQNGYPIRNLVTSRVAMSPRFHELPEPYRSDWFDGLPDNMRMNHLTSAFFHTAIDMSIISMPPGGWHDWTWTDEEVEIGGYQAQRLITLYDGDFPSYESIREAAQLIYGWREVSETVRSIPSNEQISDSLIPLSDFEQFGFEVEWHPNMSMGMGVLRRGNLEIIAINMGHGIAVNYRNRSMTFSSIIAPQVVDGVLMLPNGLIEEILETLDSH